MGTLPQVVKFPAIMEIEESLLSLGKTNWQMQMDYDSPTKVAMRGILLLFVMDWSQYPCHSWSWQLTGCGNGTNLVVKTGSQQSFRVPQQESWAVHLHVLSYPYCILLCTGSGGSSFMVPAGFLQGGRIWNAGELPIVGLSTVTSYYLYLFYYL